MKTAAELKDNWRLHRLCTQHPRFSFVFSRISLAPPMFAERADRHISSKYKVWNLNKQVISSRINASLCAARYRRPPLLAGADLAADTFFYMKVKQVRWIKRKEYSRCKTGKLAIKPRTRTSALVHGSRRVSPGTPLKYYMTRFPIKKFTRQLVHK